MDATQTNDPITKEIPLRSGKKAVIRSFKGRDIRNAQKIAGDDTSMVIFAIIAQTVTIDGQTVTAEEVDEMDGMDVFDLLSAFGAGFIVGQIK